MKSQTAALAKIPVLSVAVLNPTDLTREASAVRVAQVSRNLLASTCRNMVREMDVGSGSANSMFQSSQKRPLQKPEFAAHEVSTQCLSTNPSPQISGRSPQVFCLTGVTHGPRTTGHQSQLWLRQVKASVLHHSLVFSRRGIEGCKVVRESTFILS